MGEVLQVSGLTVTNQGRTVTMKARAKCEKGEALLILPLCCLFGPVPTLPMSMNISFLLQI